ncbi:zinc finger MYM-type protein 1-like [Ranitomeya imitator]|uniref:zinc finger MYM-type protein 1-like n=2 Tax=Ranitomeya imitator TaxID=111125 RepID=UPI0037E7D7FA
MKRRKESGAMFRKKKKAKEEELKKNEGALLKYLSHDTTTPVAEEIPKFTASDTSAPSTSGTNEQCDDQDIDPSAPSTSGTNEQCDDQDIDPSAPSTSGTNEQCDDQDIDPSAPSTSRSNEECDDQNIPAIDLKDVGLWPSKINDDTRILLVRQGASVVQHLDSDFAEVVREGASIKGQNRKLTRNWFFKTLPNNEKMLRSWLLYSPSKKALYCFCCRLFADAETSQSNFDSVNGFNTWWKLNPKVYNHESSVAHVECFTKWKELEIGLQRGVTIDKKVQEEVENNVKKWREILARLLDIIRFLAKQNLALRGHREVIHHETDYEPESTGKKGNFLELVHLLAKYDPVLREHILRIKFGKKFATSYFSPTIQNEFIEILGGKVRSKVVEQVKIAKYFSMIFDSTPDISHKDQMCQVLRYVMINGKEVKVVESFVDFIEIKGKTSESISTVILQQLEKYGIDIQNCRGQAYDNAAVMAGQHTGVQRRIKEINKKAEFVACTNHSLNLAGVHAASVALSSVTFFGTVERLFTFFSSSTHRWDVLISVTGQSVKRVLETRWSARGDAVSAVKKNYSKILQAVEQLTGEEENRVTRSDAGVLLVALQSFSFLCFLGLWESVLKEINDTQVYLQTKGLNIQQCDTKLGALKAFLTENREELVKHSVAYAKEICEDLGIDMDRRSRKKKKMAGEQSQDAALPYETELMREMYLSLDRVIQEITTRFQQLHALAEKYAFLTPSHLLDDKYECQLNQDHDDINKEEFLIERKRLKSFLYVAVTQDKKETWKEDSPLELLQFIVKYSLENSVPNIVILLRIFLTIAVSVATCERSFSKLKLIKNYLRSTMSAMRLGNMAILSIEHQLSEEIDFDDVINDFANRKARKVKF